DVPGVRERHQRVDGAGHQADAAGPRRTVAGNSRIRAEDGKHQRHQTATSTAGTGFFEPGARFSNPMSVNISNRVGVSSITVVDSTHLTLNLNTLGATPGAVTIMVTNPDGQSVTVGGLLSVSGVQITGDFDGDLKSDMTLYKTDGTWAILRSNSGFTASTMVSWGGAGYVAVPRDYHGDRKIHPP